ncbi:MAG: DUF4198 domain-containing protein [Hydrogenothermaceae bacterium]|nr:DUF4198 domain-containing protein [Hydrogenothermaceae bacterium]
MKKLVLALLLLFNISFSHELWIEESENGYTLLYGHLNPQVGEDKFVKYSPENVLDVKCFDHQRKEKNVKVEKVYPFKIVGKCDLLYILFSTGYWTKTPYGFKNLPKNKVNMPIESWQSFESIKKLSSFIDTPLTDNLEISPLQNPFNIHVGEKLTVLVTYGKKPLKDVIVAYDGKPIGTTDDEGKINIRIKHPYQQYISTSYKIKSDGVKADSIIYTSILNFEVK